MLIMGDAEADCGYFMAHIGELSNTNQSKLEFIKRCQIWETIDTPHGVLPLNKEIVLKAIEKLNEVNHTWLMKFKETEKIVCVCRAQ